MLRADLKLNLKTIEDFPKFVDSFRREVIQRGLDRPIFNSVSKLKEELYRFLDEGTRETVSRDTEQGEREVSIPKSDRELMQYLFDVDFSKFQTAKDYSTLHEAKIAIAQPSRNRASASRITLRIDMIPGDTIENQYAQATKYFNEALIGIPNETGGVDFFINPGLDLSQFIKIKCSTATGIDSDYKEHKSRDGKKALSPRERFNRDFKKGYAEWTLKQSFVDRIPDTFINVSEILASAKALEYEQALIKLGRYKKTNKISEVIEKINTVSSGKETTPEVDTFIKAATLINNIIVVKYIKSDKTIYELVSTITLGNEYKKFNTQFKAIVRDWIVLEEDKWFKRLVEITNALIKGYE